MRTTVTVVQMLVRLVGTIQLVLGVLFWTGNALSLVPVHMLTGILLVLGLWIMAALAAVTRAAPGLGVVAVIWGLIVPALGVTQTALMPGDPHWVIQVVHLLTGLALLGLVERLAMRIKRHLTARTATVAAMAS